MDDVARQRRRRRRRVADDKRKRAARACDRCKARKSKCIESTPGRCQRCMQKNLTCKFEMEPSTQPTGPSSPVQVGSTLKNTIAPSDTAEESISINSHQADRVVWPRFLSRLREALYLDTQSSPEAQDMMAMQSDISGHRGSRPTESRLLRQAIDVFPPRPVADFLLSVCIKHGTDAFFYFDQSQLLSEIDSFYNDAQSQIRSDCGFVGLALAVFALGSQWTTMVKPTDISPSTAFTAIDNDPGRIFHEQLKSLVPELIERPCLRSIQVLFIMSVYLLPSSAVGSSYVYMGLALRKALAFDLHHSADENIDLEEIERRRRLWWSIYSLERITAIKLNKSRIMDLKDVSIGLPSPVAAMDQKQVFDNVQHQIALAKLVKVLDRVVDVNHLKGRDRINAIAQVEEDLKQWKHSLPPEFKLADIQASDPSYRAVLHLYLNYYYAWIAMGKVSVVAVVRAYLRQHLGENDEPLSVEPAVRDLSLACVKAATKILRLFETLKNTANITRFSFTDFQGCSIATIISLLSGIMERDAGYESRVGFGLGCLRKMATGNTTAKVGVRFVEALQSMADEAVERLRNIQTTVRRPVESEGTEATAAEYSRWTMWLSKMEESSHPSVSTPTNTLQQTAPSTLSMQNAEALQSTIWTGPSREVSVWSEPEQIHLLEPVPPLLSTDSFGPLSDMHSDPLFVIPDIIPTSLYGDDQNFFMGMTGLDCLDFSELTTPF